MHVDRCRKEPSPPLMQAPRSRAAFKTRAGRDEVVERYHAIEGGKQTLGRLALYVADLIRKGR